MFQLVCQVQAKLWLFSNSLGNKVNSSTVENGEVGNQRYLWIEGPKEGHCYAEGPQGPFHKAQVFMKINMNIMVFGNNGLVRC